MIDKIGLQNELIEAFICKEYADSHGVMEYDFRDKAVNKYTSDPTFNQRVRYAVAFVINIVLKHDKESQ